MKELNERLDDFSKRITSIPFLTSIRDGLGSTWLFLGAISFLTLLISFPIESYQHFMANNLIYDYVRELNLLLIKLYLIVILLSTAYYYANHQQKESFKASSLGLFFYVSLYPMDFFKNYSFLDLFSFKKMIPSIVLTLVLLKVFFKLEEVLENREYTSSIPPMVIESLTVYLPIVFILGVNSILAYGLYRWKNIFIVDLVERVLIEPVFHLGRSVFFPVVYQFFSTLLWFFGINGPSVTNIVYSPITTSLTLENLQASLNNQPIVNIQSWAFSDFLANYGGGGSTLSLVILMLFFSQSDKYKEMAKLSLIPALFGINEMIIFGFPIILNMNMFIPFILVPTLNMTLAYLATYIGLIPKMSGLFIPWTTPIFVSGWLLTGSMRTVVFQGVQLLLGCILYYPFFKKEDIKQKMIENEM